MFEGTGRIFFFFFTFCKFFKHFVVETFKTIAILILYVYRKMDHLTSYEIMLKITRIKKIF